MKILSVYDLVSIDTYKERINVMIINPIKS